MNVSAVMIVKNGARTIQKSLESLREFDDVIVYDNGSSDGTQSIASEFPNVRLIEGEFDGFGTTKNRAVHYANHDWVLIIDSDEVVDEELLHALKTRILDPNAIYIVNFLAYYKDIPIRHCGWNNQKIRRLYNKTVTKFNDNFVHENIIDEGMKKLPIAGNMKHYSYMSISDFIVKLDRYSTLFATDNVGKKSSSPAKAFFNGLYSFFRTYVLKRGFLDGYAGLIIAFSHMATNFYKYIKLYEMNLEQKSKRGN
ncbi:MULTISPECIES: glycosyltransferase family 2 protein [unclassified Sulfuricurvum]|uniref:glycosyltransferase family 2 protein n=1 Tax=unclassified Sulfuricurvum TaxID=2632390 RepID=UPI0002998B1B|nr:MULTISPECIES: glycosyltransferase family 2 protein [unclassified Sulfuricurvum]AFV98300.1 family 2 glycosyl transferase [Candidatus Sulfuricurvum sp. RIFRC-1]HBM34829.1 glycosyltransferase family 2 protein [Sulfuricurvum sp.]